MKGLVRKNLVYLTIFNILYLFAAFGICAIAAFYIDMNRYGIISITALIYVLITYKIFSYTSFYKYLIQMLVCITLSFVILWKLATKSLDELSLPIVISGFVLVCTVPSILKYLSDKYLLGIDSNGTSAGLPVEEQIVNTKSEMFQKIQKTDINERKSFANNIKEENKVKKDFPPTDYSRYMPK